MAEETKEQVDSRGGTVRLPIPSRLECELDSRNALLRSKSGCYAIIAGH